MIGFVLPEASSAVFEVHDVAGRLVYTLKGDFVKGENVISLEKADLPTGVLVYSLRAGEDFGVLRPVNVFIVSVSRFCAICRYKWAEIFDGDSFRD